MLHRPVPLSLPLQMHTMILKHFLFCCTIVFLQYGCTAQDAAKPSAGILFYNLENLYDTINDPNKDDEVF